MESLKLIDGKYSAQEARDILLSLISSKINFHALRDFSSQERTGEPALTSRERIKELQKAKGQIIGLIEKAEKEGLILEIHSSVNISFSPKE